MSDDTPHAGFKRASRDLLLALQLYARTWPDPVEIDTQLRALMMAAEAIVAMESGGGGGK